ncbi:MAG: hypothetical protein TYPL_1780 [Candidatus Tyloplasma litorale]|nr:MAG: hypothetical protein TYPL_1780 [Mycoplasmatales bacterium]
MEPLIKFVVYIITTIIITSISSFIPSYLIIKYVNRKKHILFKLELKIKSTFLWTDFTEEELKNREINGDERKLIKSFYNHFKFIEEFLLEYGFYDKRKAILIREEFLNNKMRPFLIKWEKYNNSDLDYKNFSTKQKNELFNDLKNLKEYTKKFFEKKIFKKK